MLILNFRPFQAAVGRWLVSCFKPPIPHDKVERGDRLLEEVFELLQSGGYDPDRVLALRDYVWSRPVGEPNQEMGGVVVTLAAYAFAHEIDVENAANCELARISRPEMMEKIRAKQAAKPRGSALPIEQSSAAFPAGEEVVEFLKGVTGVVDANRFEQITLWKGYHQNAAWIDNRSGFGPVVGRFAGMPVCVGITTAQVHGRKLLFVDAHSQVVDYRLVDAWLEKNLPKSAFLPDGRINRVDAANFHNVFRDAPPTPANDAAVAPGWRDRSFQTGV